MRSNKKTIYYDGSCEVCSNIMLRVGNSAMGNGFDKVNLNTGPIPDGLTRHDLIKEIHVIENDGTIHRNFDAILNILEEYPGLKILSKLGRLPLFNQIGALGYKIFAVNRHYLLGTIGRIFWTKVIVSLGMISAIIITQKLWMTNRSFPLAPLIENTPSLSAFWDPYIFFTLLTLLFAIIFFPKPNKLIFFFCSFFGFLLFFDISRLQIFFYQYVFMLLSIGFFSWNYKDTKKATIILHTCRLIVICVYFWGGLQKMNFSFMFGVFPWFIEPITKILPDQISHIASLSGIIIPFFEMGIGLALMNKLTRPFAIIGATTMHIFILFSLGPFGHNWAPSVWPWNIVMILLLFILFFRTQFTMKEIFLIKNFAFHKLVLVLFAIMPFFSFFNAWDSNLSFTMYSGNLNNAVIVLNESIKTTLPDQIKKHISTDSSNLTTLDIYSWAHDEFKVLPYPETQVYKVIAQDLCQYSKSYYDIKLIIQGKPTIFNSGRPSFYECHSQKLTQL